MQMLHLTKMQRNQRSDEQYEQAEFLQDVISACPELMNRVVFVKVEHGRTYITMHEQVMKDAKDIMHIAEANEIRRQK